MILDSGASPGARQTVPAPFDRLLRLRADGRPKVKLAEFGVEAVDTFPCFRVTVEPIPAGLPGGHEGVPVDTQSAQGLVQFGDVWPGDLVEDQLGGGFSFRPVSGGSSPGATHLPAHVRGAAETLSLSALGLGFAELSGGGAGGSAGPLTVSCAEVGAGFVGVGDLALDAVQVARRVGRDGRRDGRLLSYEAGSTEACPH
jgi:hypothetical protein